MDRGLIMQKKIGENHEGKEGEEDKAMHSKARQGKARQDLPQLASRAPQQVFFVDPSASQPSP